MYEREEKPPAPLIVTGLSGAGISTALKHLEDMGYEAFDNFPLSLAADLVKDPAGTGRAVAIGIDTRSRGFSPEALADAVETLEARLLFLTADDSVLFRRFSETRRRHPLAKDRPVADGIAREMEWLQPLKALAETVIDTSDLSVHDLRRHLERAYTLNKKEGRLTVTLISFGYRNGLPRDADIIMDLRFLANPHWEPSLRPLTGQDEKVQAYVRRDPDFKPLVDNLQNLLTPLFARYAEEGKSYLTLAFGCSGGRHRSVAMVETMKPWLESRGFDVTVVHRDMDKPRPA